MPYSIAPKSREFLNDENLRWVTSLSDDWRIATDRYKREICSQGIYEIYLKYNQPGHKVFFEAAIERFEDKYFSIEDSMDILKHLLVEQFGDGESGQQFMCYLLRLFTRRNGKKNCLVLYGDHSKGKTWWVRALSGVAVTTGETQTLNKNNNFPLMGMTDCNMLIFDELNYDPTMFASSLKTLLSGDITTVDVKYQGQQPVMKTMILVMNNHRDIFPQNDVYHSRINYINWRLSSDIPMHKNLHPWVFFTYWIDILGQGKWPTEDILLKDTTYM